MMHSGWCSRIICKHSQLIQLSCVDMVVNWWYESIVSHACHVFFLDLSAAILVGTNYWTRVITKGTSLWIFITDSGVRKFFHSMSIFISCDIKQ